MLLAGSSQRSGLKKKISDLSKENQIHALDLHSKSIVINGMDPTHNHDFGDQYIEKLGKAGITGENVTTAGLEVNFGEAIKGGGPLNEWNGVLLWHNLVESQAKLLHATSVQDIERAKEQGKIALIFGFQSAEPIEGNVDLLKVFHALGVRIVQLTYQRRNLVGDGAGERTNCGLSSFGVKVVECLNKLKMVVDLSHAGERTSMEAMEVSKEPVVFSHAGMRGVFDHTRNLSDVQVKALAERGGVIGIVGYSTFLSHQAAEKGASMEDYLDHVDYAVNLVGVDHVGIGLDSRPDTIIQEDVEASARAHPSLGVTAPMRYRYVIRSITDTVDITKGLVARGYSDQEIEKILGLNFLRVFRRVWGN
jgi:membrane dipeptidase